MRFAISAVKPDAVIHLGDYFDDGLTIAEEYSHIRFYQVPGNCDRFRCAPWQTEILSCSVCGVMMYMTHGHLHGVKSDTGRLLADARKSGARIVLYGHTHIPDCRQETDGLWVLNPGTCGSYGGSVGLIAVSDNKISSCRILRQEDLEALLP